jgi:hypothetical protein
MGMKDSTIKMVLRKKVKGWLESIEDPVRRERVAANVIVTGGAIPSMILGEEVNDYDLYFKSQDAAMTVAKYYVDVFNRDNGFMKGDGAKNYKPTVIVEKRVNIHGDLEDRIVLYMKSAGVASEGQGDYEYFEARPESSADEFIGSINFDDVENIAELAKKPFRPVFLSENAVTLTGKVQLILRFYGDAEQIHRNFDFLHATGWYDYSEDTLHYSKEALRSMLSKTLVYCGSLYPLASIFRVRKFIQRGWRISAGQLLKMAWQISEIDLKDKDVLREQLLGVDVAYMRQLVDELSNGGERVDAAYLSKLIDKIFEEDLP